MGVMALQAEGSQKKKKQIKKPAMAIDKGSAGRLGWCFHQQLWISGQFGQGFSFRLLGKVTRWQRWVSHASPSLRMGQLAPEEA